LSFFLTLLFYSGVLGLGNNKLVGTLPSEFGNMERLGSLQLQNNSLNGTLPDDITFLSGLTRLQLDFNNFDGTLPVGLGNLTMLKELTLQGNNFTGEIPTDVCTSVSLQQASVDCDKVACACCDGCESVADTPNDGPDETPTPTDSTAQQPTATPTMSPSTETSTETTTPIDSTLPQPTAAPTMSLSSMETGTVSPAPTACQAIQTVRDCYEVEESINFDSFNCEPSEFDVVALYRVQDLRESGLRNALFWMPACMDTECSFSMDDGFLFRGDSGTSVMLETAPWPFTTEDYVLFLFRVFEPGSLEIIAESAPFIVAEQCPTTDP
jgi:hypothetical protein